jgi:glutaconate CoA-transferase subunit B
MVHQKRRFVERVDYITSPGYGTGAAWRKLAGLARGGPSAVITTLGVLRFDPSTREMVLASLHPGVALAEVRDNTGWRLQTAASLDFTPVPDRKELEMLRRFDPEGFWTGRTN